MSRGYHTIYLGESVPIEDLNLLHNAIYEDITYVTYFTIKPDPSEKVEGYLKKLYGEVVKDTTNNSVRRFLGTRFIDSKPKKLPKGMKLYESIKKLVKDL